MSIKVQQLAIPDVLIVTPDRYYDDRGSFSEIYSEREFEACGITFSCVQENSFVSCKKGVLRGIHFQKCPRAQSKLVRCDAGKMKVVAVDFRVDSPTFLQHVSIMLEGHDGKQVLVPKGFGHGCIALSDDAIGTYKVDEYYSPEHEQSVFYDDPSLSITWGEEDIFVSEKDAAAPLIKDIHFNFTLENCHG